MWHILIYNLLLFTSVPYALIRGGAPERICGALAFAATVLTAVSLALSPSMYHVRELGAFAIDGVTLCGFAAVALLADRHWPLFVAGLQGAAVVVHLSKVVLPGLLPFGYAIALSIWGYPILFLLAVGTRRHRQRLALFGSDRAWSRVAFRVGP